MISLFDIRTKNPVTIFTDHSQEICGIKFSPTGEYFASGGNDNKFFVFSLKMSMPLFKKNHKAAIKALDWSQTRGNIVVTGSG